MTGRFPWLDYPPLARLLQALNGGGEEARVVGGAVRSTLLGEPVKDWDIATTASTDVVTERCRAMGWRTVPTGLDHGTVTVIIEGLPFEVTTLREDLEGDGRRAVVRFGRDFRADALRRDFTINALSVSLDGDLHDYADGLADIANRRVRFIGDPDQRIREDYLRILRLFRFHARYGKGAVDKDALAAAIRGRKGLAVLSGERVRAEMLRLVVASGAAAALSEMDGAGLLLAVLGGVALVERFAALAALEAGKGLEPDAMRRLAALAVFTAEEPPRLRESLRLSNQESRRLLAIAQALETLRAIPVERNPRALAYRLGKSAAVDAILIGWAESSNRAWQGVLDPLLRWTVPPLPWTGGAVISTGIAPGPAVGAILADAETAWIAADFPSDPTRQNALLSAAIAAWRSSRGQP